MNYEEMLKKCNHYLRVGSIEDITEFLPDLMNAYDVLELEQVNQSDGFENRRDELAIMMKKAKIEGKVNKTEADIDRESKHRASHEYPNRNVYKVVVKHFEKYIEQLNSRKIKLMSDDKQQREIGY